MAKYLKHDSELGFVEDNVEIQALQFNNARHSVLSCMLGDFDEFGNYVVNPQIVKELIEMPKYIVDTMENIEICHSAIKFDKQISFMAVFEGNKATLSLIEKINYEANNKINSGTWSNINEFVLDEVETSGEINRNSLYLKWNIQRYTGEVIDIFNCDNSVLAKYFGLVNRFKHNLRANTILLEKEEELEEVEAEYFLEVYELLKNYPELKKAVDKQLKQNFTEKKEFLLLDKPNFTKTLNEVMEKAIQDNINLLPPEKSQEFFAEKRAAILNANIKKQNIVEVSGEKLEEIKVDNEKNNQPQTETKVVRLKSSVVAYEDLNKVGKDFVEANTNASKRNEEKAEEFLLGKSAKKAAKVIETLLKTGIVASSIASAAILTAVAKKKEAEKEIKKTTEPVENTKKPTQQVKKPTKSETKDAKKKPAKKKAAEKGKDKSAPKSEKKEPAKVEAVQGFVVSSSSRSSAAKSTGESKLDSSKVLTPVAPEQDNLVEKTSRRKSAQKESEVLAVPETVLQAQQDAEAKAEAQKIKNLMKSEKKSVSEENTTEVVSMKIETIKAEVIASSDEAINQNEVKHISEQIKVVKTSNKNNDNSLGI